MKNMGSTCTQCGKPTSTGQELCDACRRTVTLAPGELSLEASTANYDQPTIADHAALNTTDSNAAHRSTAKDPDTVLSESGHGADGPGSVREALSIDGERIPQACGDYDLLEELARGGMGVVYRARHRTLNRLVALKMILNGRFSSKEAVQRFHMEAEAAAKLDHPGIVPVYDTGAEDGCPYFTMKLLEGGSLATRKEEFRGRPKAIAALLQQTAEAVHHAHQRGILHRDIKPANILLDEQGSPLLTDLGLARSTGTESGLTQTNAVLGTPGYMAPEQARPQTPVTTAADIYAIGAILYELLTGRPPHTGDSAVTVVMSVLNEPVTPPGQIEKGVDSELELICMKCLEKSPDDRYASAADLATDLRRFSEGRPISIRPPSVALQVRQWLRRNQTIGWICLATLTAGIVATPVILSLLGALDNPAALYLGTDEDPRPLLFSLSDVPMWVSIVAAVLLILLWPLLGAFITLLSKPRSILTALRNGFLTGLLCSGLFIAMLGWVPFSLSAQGTSNITIRRLAALAYPTDSISADDTRKWLERRYPMLPNRAPRERAQYLTNRLFADGLATGPYVLFGVSLVGLFLMIPQILGAVIMQALRLRGHRWWALWPRYLVAWFSGYISISVGLAAFTGGRFNGNAFYELPLPQQIVILTAPPIVLYLSLRRWTRTAASAELSG